MQSIRPRSLSELLSADGEQPVLLDVREAWEFEICQIPGSRNVPMSSVPAIVESLDPSAATVVICHHGMRSAQVGGYLEQRGFENVINLEGGVDAWAREVDPTMSTY